MRLLCNIYNLYHTVTDLNYVKSNPGTESDDKGFVKIQKKKGTEPANC